MSDNSRIRILKLALREAVRAGDEQAAKRLTARLAEILTVRTIPVRKSVAVH